MFLDEMCSFPKGSHDDIVDATVQGLRYMTQPKPGEGLINYYQGLLAAQTAAKAQADKPEAVETLPPTRAQTFWDAATARGGVVRSL